MRITLICLFSLLSTSLFAQSITVNGYIREKGSLESLPGVTVSVRDHSWGVVSNAYGFYSLQIPSNQSFTLYYSSVGYQGIERNINSATDIDLSIELNQKIRQLDEVVVKTEPQAAEMSVIRLPIAQIKQVPTLLGEKDVIKALQLLPGVQKGTEGFTALYVRGGGPDQNLILLDEAQVYNANHVFGLFSTFNGDAIKNVSFWKGRFPARYGGRLSSVIDLQMKEGNKQKIHGEGGIGLLSSRLTPEGPLVKNKSSFLIAYFSKNRQDRCNVY
ncbi:carboxypeptidase-like regulatory domain-containing protein [Dyadobacter sp. CY345]|uniref:TonB-dependent receptor n=1 Tax=Dyadobacter sp. CY345 TaxID=2909335 RepID=UPI001F2506F9|nr:carboxypeptidase-like regulatory domain-containing protein [Dyadobacter sp. CY345]MCF2443391.1 carboxypeptidase-like regulatory domain-containing protein [Dyadobacter sp. CY345]